MSQVMLGAKFDMNDSTNTYGTPLGAIATDKAGNEYMFVQAAAGVTQYAFVSVDEAGQATMITKTLADTRASIGCAQTALSSGYYGWVLVRGIGTGLVKASCAADVALYTSATAGYLDDDATSQTKVLGAVVTTTRAASDGSAPINLTVRAQVN